MTNRGHCALTFLPAVLVACALAVPSSAVAQDQIGVQGRVVAADTGKPLAGARIALPQERTSFRTDAAGRFEFSVPASDPTYVVSKPGYVSMPFRASKGARNLVVRIQRGGVIVVHVYDPAGTPGRTPVRILGEGKQRSASATAASTDDRGQFRLANLPEDRYTITLRGTTAVQVRVPPRELSDQEVGQLREEMTRRSRSASRDTSVAVTVRAGQEVVVHMVIPSASADAHQSDAPATESTAAVEGRVAVSEVTGRVLDEFGEPVQFANVLLLGIGVRADGARELVPVGVGLSDDLGRYRIPQVAPGTYGLLTLGESLHPGETSLYYPGAVSLGRSQPLEVPAGRDVMGIDFRLNPDLGRQITGRVIQSTAGSFAGMTAELGGTDADGVVVRTRTATVSRSGEFEFLNVGPGRYTVSVRPPPTSFALPPISGGRVVRTPMSTESGAVQIQIGEAQPEPVVIRTAPQGTPAR